MERRKRGNLEVMETKANEISSNQEPDIPKLSEKEIIEEGQLLTSAIRRYIEKTGAKSLYLNFKDGKIEIR